MPHGSRDDVQQSQFLHVLTRDEAERRFRAHLTLEPLGLERVPLREARGRVLAEDIAAPVDVPGFDRSNVDGFAVRSEDTVGASEESPVELRLNPESLAPGVMPRHPVTPGTATPIATGGMVPRGADAVVMVEQTELRSAVGGAAVETPAPPTVLVRRSVAAGEAVTFAGTDLARGEIAVWRGELLTAREIGVLAAIGCREVPVFRRPTVGIIATGDEVRQPGEPLPPGCVYDANSHLVAATVEELGGIPVLYGTVPDDPQRLREVLRQALEHDVVVLSGGTSKGAGDLSYRIVGELSDPGIIAHGVALKPGKPICLAATRGRPVVILPGFPTSAIFTFHEFLAPVLLALGGRGASRRKSVPATLPLQLNSERGRTEYNLVSLVSGKDGLAAYPLGKGSGSVTTFAHADGFITIDQHTEIVPAESPVEVTLLDESLAPADLVVIGSHCVGLDWLLGRLRAEGFRIKSLSVGSQGGLLAARRGECDLAGMHLLDPRTGEYNRPFLDETLELLPGYRRRQCLVYRRGDARFEGRDVREALRAACSDPECVLINRNPGSGTRILLDRWLEELGLGRGPRPSGYAVQARSHNAVAAAVAQGRADWGIAIETVARPYGLGSIPLADEHYDFAVPRSRRSGRGVSRFAELLQDPEIRDSLRRLGFEPP